jgi:hypothetical protein
MADAPRQNWALYEARTAATDAVWLRSLSISDRFALYASLFNLIWSAPRDPEALKRLECWRWQQKLALRMRMVDAFRKLDELQDGRGCAFPLDPCSPSFEGDSSA